MSVNQNFIKRIINNIDSNGSKGCWIWTGNLDKDGYGRICINYKKIKVHRLIASLFGLKIDKKLVCHSCDNPTCVNPIHLWVGSSQDNSTDMVFKKRSLKGVKKPLEQKIKMSISENKRKRNSIGEFL